MNGRSGLVALCLLSLPMPSLKAEALRHDPFVAPAFAQANGLKQSTSLSGMGNDALGWAPQISLLMKAGRDSMAVVDGVVVRLGEMVDGHRLVKITHDEALFINNGKQVLVKIKPLKATAVQKESKP